MFFTLLSYSQSSIINYNFSNSPQSLLLNPAYDIQAQYHVTLPFFGGNKISLESSGITAYDLFAKNNIHPQDKIKNVVYQLKKNDFLLGNQIMELINIGQRLNRDTYISYGVYEEVDVYSTLPVEILRLGFETTSYQNKEYHLNGFYTNAKLQMVYHAGIQKRINKKLQLGARLKLYNTSANIITHTLDGSFQTKIENSKLTYQLSSIDIAIKTSGFPLKLDDKDRPVTVKIVDSNGEKRTYFVLNTQEKDSLLTLGKLIGNSFINGSKGIGVDLGIQYKTKNDLTFSASINDLGLVYSNNLTQNYGFQGNYQNQGVSFENDPTSNNTFDTVLLNDIKENIPLKHNNKRYVSFLSFKTNLMATYGFGGFKNNQCHVSSHVFSRVPIDKVGVHLYSQYRRYNFLYEASIFYERKITNSLLTRINYTVNKYSASNLGLAVSGQLGKVNLYAGVNNIMALSNLAKANSIAVQFGINILLPNRF